MGRFLLDVVIFLVILRCVHPLSSGEKCADLQFDGFRDGETAKVEEKTYFNVTFHINTTKCTTLPTWIRVKVSYYQANFTVDVCSIIFEAQKCEIADQSSYCRCVNELNAQLYREFNTSGNVSYIWSLSDTLSGQMQKKAQIIFDVSNVDRRKKLHKTSAAVTTPTPSTLDPDRDIAADTDVGTSPGVTDTRYDGVNLQVIFFNTIITVGVIGIAIVIAIVIYIYRSRKGTDSLFPLSGN